MTELDLEAIEERATFATEGPWAPWLDQDGADHMHGLLMVGNADAVIPEGEVYIEGVDVNPVAHIYTPEDREFIANARADIPALVHEVRSLRAAAAAVDELHRPHNCDDEDGMCAWAEEAPGEGYVCQLVGTCDHDGYPWPCPTHTALHPEETRHA